MASSTGVCLPRRIAGIGRGQPKGEPRPLAGDALDADVATHDLRQIAADREPEPGPAMRPGVAGVDLHERVKYPVQVVMRDSHARVLNRDAGPALRAIAWRNRGLRRGAATNRDTSACGRELDGVRQQVRDDLLNALRIAEVFGARIAD